MKEEPHMKRILSLLGVAIVSVILLPTVGVQASSISPAPSRLPMRVTILPSSGPHTLTRKRRVALHLSVKGLVLDARNIGKKAKPGHGHIQVYFDRIPSDAYRIADLRGM